MTHCDEYAKCHESHNTLVLDMYGPITYGPFLGSPENFPGPKSQTVKRLFWKGNKKQNDLTT